MTESEGFNSYGIKFKPIIKEKIWGGSKLREILEKPASDSAGESWEISTVKGDVSEVNNGFYKGWRFDHLIKKYRNEILGRSVVSRFGNEFPLLIKFIDASEHLSVQVHPGDEMARKYHNSFGKTEMWYIMQADKEAAINAGWRKNIDLREYHESLKKGNLLDYLKFIQVHEGDSFLINAGKVHAIGKGVMLAEIQQTSDVTYRVYDWDRTDDQGNSRELHVDLAGQAMDFSLNDDYTVDYTPVINHSCNLVDCKFFTTNVIEVEGNVKRDYTSLDSFVIFMCVKGKVEIDIDGEKDVIRHGECILIPAISKSVSIEGSSSRVLEVYISKSRE